MRPHFDRSRISAGFRLRAISYRLPVSFLQYFLRKNIVRTCKVCEIFVWYMYNMLMVYLKYLFGWYLQKVCGIHGHLYVACTKCTVVVSYMFGICSASYGICKICTVLVQFPN